MKIALTQMNICWEQPETNKDKCEQLAMQAEQNACDYIVFPEMTLTGFTMHPEHFVPNDDCAFFKNLARIYHIGIVFGYIEASPKGYLNKMAIADCHGELIFDYAKLHPFSYGEESKHYIGGDRISVTKLQCDTFNNISHRYETPLYMSGFICYDLRFPEIFQQASSQASIIFVIANWPEVRIDHWHTLLKARALENQCFIIGVNRIGEGDGLQYKESSVVYDPYGNLISPQQSTDLLYVDIDPGVATQYRKTFPIKADRRDDLYKSLTIQ